MADKDRDQLAAALETLICVMAAQVGRELPLSERAPLLMRLGLDSNQVARVCDTTPDAVRARLSEAKRRTSKGTKKPASKGKKA